MVMSLTFQTKTLQRIPFVRVGADLSPLLTATSIYSKLQSLMLVLSNNLLLLHVDGSIVLVLNFDCEFEKNGFYKVDFV